jgi:hypothetical protein
VVETATAGKKCGTAEQPNNSLVIDKGASGQPSLAFAQFLYTSGFRDRGFDLGAVVTKFRFVPLRQRITF